MKIVEKSGKTTDEAIEAALKELGVLREDVEVEILEYPTRGLFGFIGSRAAKVKVCLPEKQIKKSQVEKKYSVFESEKKTSLNKLEKAVTIYEEEPVKFALEFLDKIFSKLGVKVKNEVTQDNGFIYLSFSGDDLGILIGRRGETLDSLQYLVNLVVGKKTEQKYRIILDVEGYRKRREETLIKLAQRLSEKVKKTGHNIVLEPMNPHERRIIHTALQNDIKIRTFSEGEEPYRKVVITKKR